MWCDSTSKLKLLAFLRFCSISFELSLEQSQHAVIGIDNPINVLKDMRSDTEAKIQSMLVLVWPANEQPINIDYLAPSSLVGELLLLISYVNFRCIDLPHTRGID